MSENESNIPLRILKICHEYPPVGGGGASVCAALAKEYERSGHTVTILTMGFGDLAETETSGKTTIHRVKTPRRKKEMATALEGLIWSWKCICFLEANYPEMPFDIVHAHFIMPAGIVAERLKNKHDIPFIVTPHGTDVPGYNSERMKFIHILINKWWKHICRQTGVMTCPSESLLNMLRKSAPFVSGQVVPNGFTPGKFKRLKKEKRFLLCSRLVKRKGFQYFLEAVRNLDLPGWEADIVGDGPYAETLKEMAKECNIKVRMRGWIDNTDPLLARLYGQAMIFVLPSDWENFSIALLEAMSAGCTVITTDISGNPEVIGDTGRLIKAGDVECLRNALQELSCNPARCKEFGNMAEQRAVEMFNWADISTKYIDIMTSVTNRNTDTRTKTCFISMKAYPIFDPTVTKVTHGGAEVQLALLARELANNPDYNVHFIVADFGQAESVVCDGVTVWRSLKLADNYIKQALTFLAQFKRIDASIYINRMLSVSSGLLAYYAHKKKKKFIYMVAHDSETDGKHPSLKNPLKRPFAQMTFKYASSVIVQNEYQKTRLMNQGVKCKLIPSSYPITESHHIHKPHVLWVARAEAIKQPELYIKLAEMHPETEFIMIAPPSNIYPELHAPLKERASSAKNLDFIDYVPFNEINKYFEEASVFINTSKQEGFPNTFVQAAINWTPIVSLNVNPDDFLNKYECGFFCSNNFDIMADKLSHLLNDDDQRNKMAENALVYAKEHHDVKDNIKLLMETV